MLLEQITNVFHIEIIRVVKTLRSLEQLVTLKEKQHVVRLF